MGIHKFSRILGVFAFLSFLNFSLVKAFNCSEIEQEGFIFDLTALNKQINTIIEEETPPTKRETVYQINPCGPLNNTQCAPDSYVCDIISYTFLNGSKEIAQIIPVAADSPERKLDPEWKLARLEKNDDEPGPLSLTLHGGFYMNAAQQAHFTFFCEKNADNEEYKISSYQDNVLKIHLISNKVCGKRKPSPPSEKKGRNAFTKFFLITVIIILTYVGIGAAYNYQYYGSTGWDLLPHRDLWRDVPYLLSDLSKSLVRFVRNGGRPGYSSI